jgi:hypothetical protein
LKHDLKKARIDIFGELEGGVIEAMKKIKTSDIAGWYRKCGFNTSMV